MRKVVAILAVVASIVGVGANVTEILPPCEFEDSANCYWDADNRGNGTGDSFIDLGGNVVVRW